MRYFLTLDGGGTRVVLHLHGLAHRLGERGERVAGQDVAIVGLRTRGARAAAIAPHLDG